MFHAAQHKPEIGGAEHRCSSNSEHAWSYTVCTV